MKDTEKKLGLTLSQIREMSPGEFKKHVEKVTGKPVTIGPAGLHGVISREQINADVDKILKKGFLIILKEKLRSKHENINFHIKSHSAFGM